MGYTHYWTQKHSVTPKEWKGITDDFKKLVQDTKPPIQFESDEASPIQIDKDHIRFNGIKNDGYETMMVSRTRGGFNFCKTARKPYDQTVAALLLIMNHHAPDCWDISSNGDRNKEWKVYSEWFDQLGFGHYEIPKGVT